MRGVKLWLWTVFLFVFAMVVVGGITRLTGSGLSMVEWRPLMGTLPPLNEQAWLETFGRYQQSPQYLQVNHWMDLEAFKRIFFWEYLHRLLGRLLGLVFVLPWLVFVAKKRIRGPLLRDTGVAFLLGGAQGLLGWFMVMSGLVDRPSVSHYRLAAHLALALFVAQWVLWILYRLRARREERATVGFRWTVVTTLAILGIQIVYGAFMAGLRAGLVSATFPDMNGSYGPAPFVSSAAALVSDPLAVHWVHRTLAWLVLAAFLWMAWRARKETPSVRNMSLAVLAVAVLQVALGALTVIYHVPVVTAVAHQGAAFVLLSALVWLACAAGVLPQRSLLAPESSLEA